jgi:hypothetical protein
VGWGRGKGATGMGSTPLRSQHRCTGLYWHRGFFGLGFCFLPVFDVL